MYFLFYNLHHHHVIPKAQGGTDNEDNFITIQSHLDQSVYSDRDFVLKTIDFGLDISLLDKKFLKDENIATIAVKKDTSFLEYFDQLKSFDPSFFLL